MQLGECHGCIGCSRMSIFNRSRSCGSADISAICISITCIGLPVSVVGLGARWEWKTYKVLFGLVGHWKPVAASEMAGYESSTGSSLQLQEAWEYSGLDGLDECALASIGIVSPVGRLRFSLVTAEVLYRPGVDSPQDNASGSWNHHG